MLVVATPNPNAALILTGKLLSEQIRSAVQQRRAAYEKVSRVEVTALEMAALKECAKHFGGSVESIVGGDGVSVKEV